MISVKGFYWAVAILGLFFFLFFWGSSPQQARDYRPLRTQPPQVLVDPSLDVTDPESNEIVAYATLEELNFAEPRVRFEPEQPLVGDTLRVVFAAGISSSEYASIDWIHNQVPVTEHTNARQLILESEFYGRGHLIQAIIRTPIWQEELAVRVYNQPPVVQGWGHPGQVGDRYVIAVRGTDPEQDEIWLEMPVNSPGILTSGMQVVIDPTQITENRSVPVALTDGEQSSLFLLHLSPKQFAGYVAPAKPMSARELRKYQSERERQRDYDRWEGEGRVRPQPKPAD